jgi:hypothetical protein
LGRGRKLPEEEVNYMVKKKRKTFSPTPSMSPSPTPSSGITWGEEKESVWKRFTGMIRRIINVIRSA